jgi:hypothetical protein
MSVSKLRLALKDGLISGINMTEEELKKSKLPFCYDCMRGSMKANAKGHTTEHSWKLFEKVAVDYKGPFSVKSHSGFTGFYLFSDYFSDYVWVYLVKRKDQFLEALTQFHQFHNVKLNIQMQMLQGDYDVMHKDSGVKEFLSMNKGIQLQLSAPYTHSQNGQVERDMQSVLDKSRTIMSAGGVPNKFWEYAVKHSCLLINYSPTSKAKNGFKSPYEIVFKKVPDVTNLVSFYSPGVYHLSKDERKALKSTLTNYKAAPCRMLGFDPLSPKK